MSSWVFPPSIDPPRPIHPCCLIKLPLACGLQITTALHELSVKMHTNPYLVVSMFVHVQPFREYWMLLIRWQLASLLELSLLQLPRPAGSGPEAVPRTALPASACPARR